MTLRFSIFQDGANSDSVPITIDFYRNSPSPQGQKIKNFHSGQENVTLWLYDFYLARKATITKKIKNYPFADIPRNEIIEIL